MDNISIYDFLSLLLSVNALGVAVYSIYIQKKAKIKLNANRNWILSSNIQSSKSIAISVTNIGVRPITIETIGIILYNKKVYLPPNSSQLNVCLSPGESKRIDFGIHDFKENVSQLNLSINQRLYLFADDSLGHRHKEKWEKIKNIPEVCQKNALR